MLCIPIIAADTDEALLKMNRAGPYGDCFEIRLDLMENFDLNRIIPGARKPVLVTYRTKDEGGNGKADPGAISEYLIDAAQRGADFIDVEMSMPPGWREKIVCNRERSLIVISTHMIDRTPSRQELQAVYRESRETGADMVKIVTRAKTWEDNLRILELIPRALDEGVKIITFCMGPMGRISRVLSLLMGAHMSFVSLEPGQESASGQIPVNEMKTMLEYFQS